MTAQQANSCYLHVKPEDSSWQVAPRSRFAFTLIELLVVIALMLIIMAMAVAILPGLSNGQRTSNAATQLQQWIEIAKQRAAKDRAPRGIRLWPGDANAMLVTKLEFLEQPDPYYLGSTANGPSVATVS